MNAFTTRIPLAVMIVMGIKAWENRSSMPSPACGTCAITCSKSSGEREYRLFRIWADIRLPAEVRADLPDWDMVSGWRGKVVATCDYEATFDCGPPVWFEGYPVWWHLTHVRFLKEPIPCRGHVGMWNLPDEIAARIHV